MEARPPVMEASADHFPDQHAHRLGCDECIKLLAEVRPGVARFLDAIRAADDPEEFCYRHLKLVCPAGKRARELASNMPRWPLHYRAFRLATDAVFGLVGLAAFLLALPFVALGILLQSPGPIFFRQPRVGLNGRTFYIYKFRTMHNTPDADTQTLAPSQQHRVFPFGRLLRATRLDELPQVINVLRGEMSIVGPRPEVLPLAEEMKKTIPHYGLRHRVPQGLTGWYQVRYHYEHSWQDSWIKLALDLYYIDRACATFDILIIAMTIPHLLWKMLGPYRRRHEENNSNGLAS